MMAATLGELHNVRGAVRALALAFFLALAIAFEPDCGELDDEEIEQFDPAPPPYLVPRVPGEVIA